MDTYALVELGKKKQKIHSDRAFAIKNGITAQNISDWKSGRATPNATKFLKLAIAAKMNIEEALEYAESMERSKPIKQAGFADLSLLTAIGGISALSLAGVTALPYALATAGFITGSLYIM